MSSDGHEPDRLWQWIDEQKRPPENRPGRRLASDLYSHDSKQNWAQAVSVSLRTGRRRPVGARFARKRLQEAIQLSLRSKYPRFLSTSPSVHRRHGAVIAATCLLLVSAAMVAALFLFHNHAFTK